MKAEATRLADALERFHAYTPACATQDRARLDQAAALLRQWPEDQSARIAELEAALKVAGEALVYGVRKMNHLGEALGCMPLHDAIQRIKEAQR